MTNTLRATAIASTIVLTYLIQAAGPSAPVLDGSPLPTPEPVTVEKPSAEEFGAEEQELVDFAYSRFALVGIKLPDVHIEFPDDEAGCFGYGGVYLPSKTTVRICRPSKTTMVHELAHSWVETTLNTAERNAFLEERGLDTWTGGTEWDERGAEHAAEIITWALMDENISLRWIDTNSDGSTTETWKLFKIPNSNPDQLAAAYEQLTGSVPQARIADDPRDLEPTAEIVSPEARRIY
jgi:hypothetical protein